MTTATKIKTWRIQWIIRPATIPWSLLHDIEGEEFSDESQAELRKTAYWEKLSFAHLMEFRIVEGTL